MRVIILTSLYKSQYRPYLNSALTKLFVTFRRSVFPVWGVTFPSLHLEYTDFPIQMNEMKDIASAWIQMIGSSITIWFVVNMYIKWIQVRFVFVDDFVQ
jgi:hypothetical protein